MSGYSEESAVRVRRVGSIAFLAWAWLGPHVSGAQAEERTDQLETVIVTGSFVPRADIEHAGSRDHVTTRVASATKRELRCPVK